jgi:hypothetical protein
MTPLAATCLWIDVISPQPGPTRESRSGAGIRVVFPVVHTPYEYYDLSSFR